MFQLTPRPWLMLAVMVFGQAATTIVTSTPAFLIPHLVKREGMSLAQAALLAGAPHLGLVLTLIAWGAITDRFGERRVLISGLTLTVVAVTLSMMAADFLWIAAAFVLTGAMSACVNNASGRLITGWFPAHRRGFAMGIRQACQPLGMAIAAIAVPVLAAQFSVTHALAFGGILTLASLVACVLVVVDPPQTPRAQARAASNPYRASSVLARIHIVSILLVIPQFVLSTFGLVWFTLGFGWSELAAGALVALSQLVGAAGRIAVGVWSDKVASRLRPLRLVAIAGVGVLLVTAGFGAAEWAVAAACAYLVASCISVADNGLAFTAVAEIAGPRWAGRALGTQNTGQFLAAAIGPPLVGALIAVAGIPATLALIALTPAIAIPLVPSDQAAHATLVREPRRAARSE